MLENDELTGTIIGCAIEVHRHMGPGFMESVYERCLLHELNQAGLTTVSQVAIPVYYKGCKLECDYRVDLIVAGQVLVELKSVKALSDLHGAQVITYMRLAKIRRGLLINFNVPKLVHGIKRFVI
ncbi:MULTISPECIES: GxxExxY protein [unclassified Alcanivorax]|uniref:GxxExxY protein n=1 Tax=unclassified Alcanivorax TaxID=2638842 RepID=UPI0008A0044E|nr:MULTISPECIES: GxxExxY protein [unclassified Alcanivorax]MEE3387398.1 GxxExxY protein [Pseudomonadota bacterium]SEG10517.1 GxxExxY protein [Alcanivorax sp. DSM 26293]